MSRAGARALVARSLPPASMVAAALALPVLPLPPYATSIVIEILIVSVATMSLDLLVGYTGLVSLGHAAFYAAGAYGAGIVALHVTGNPFVTLFAAVATASALACFYGFFAVRNRDIYFLMLTLAFGELFFTVVHQWKEVTGGSDGLVGIPRPALPGVDTTSHTGFFYLVLAVFGACLWLLRRVTRSPFGQVLVGIRENEHRVAALGYDTRRFKLAAFVLAGAVAGVSGWLFAGFNGFISPDLSSWTFSGELVLMVVIGGSGTLYGPVIGTAVVLALARFVSLYTARWPTVLGAVFIVMVLVAPEGLFGLVLNGASRRRSGGIRAGPDSGVGSATEAPPAGPDLSPAVEEAR